MFYGNADVMLVIEEMDVLIFFYNNVGVLLIIFYIASILYE